MPLPVGTVTFVLADTGDQYRAVDHQQAVCAAAGACVGLAWVVLGTAGVAGAAGAIAAGVAPLLHSAFRKSFHFWPPSVPAACAALYFALHSCMVTAWADEDATSAAKPAVTPANNKRFIG